MNIDPQRTYAFVVGVERYDMGAGWNLDGPASDALRFVAWLKQVGVPRENIWLFLTPLQEPGLNYEPATKSKIEDALFKTLADHPGGDLLYFFWGGHGVADERENRRLFYADATPTALDYNLDLNSAMRRMKRYEKFPIQIGYVDACANYFEELNGYTYSLGQTDYSQAKSPAVVRQSIFFAADMGQQALHHDRIERTGRFSHHVLNALAWPPDPDAVIAAVRPQFEGLTQRPIEIRWQTLQGDQGDVQSYGMLPSNSYVNAVAAERGYSVQQLRQLALLLAADGSRLREVAERLYKDEGAVLLKELEQRRPEPEFAAAWTRVERVRQLRRLLLRESLTLADFRAFYADTIATLGEEPKRAEASSLDEMLNELCVPAFGPEQHLSLFEYALRIHGETGTAALREWVQQTAPPALVTELDERLREEETLTLAIHVEPDAARVGQPLQTEAWLFRDAGVTPVEIWPAKLCGDWDAVSSVVAGLVRDARLVARERKLQVEFYLSPPFFHEHVEATGIQLNAWEKRRLGSLHPVTLRFRERYFGGDTDRETWADRARLSREQAACQWFAPEDDAENCSGLVSLRFVPRTEAERGVLYGLVGSGVPFMAWLRQDPPLGDWPAFEQAFGAWLGQQKFDEIPAKLAAARRDRKSHACIKESLTLFWDDPECIHTAMLTDVRQQGV